jgi:hypothetical protein
VPVPRAFADFDIGIVGDTVTFDELPIDIGRVTIEVITDDPTPDSFSAVTRNK